MVKNGPETGSEKSLQTWSVYKMRDLIFCLGFLQRDHKVTWQRDLFVMAKYRTFVELYALNSSFDVQDAFRPAQNLVFAHKEVIIDVPSPAVKLPFPFTPQRRIPVQRSQGLNRSSFILSEVYRHDRNID